MDKTFGKPWVSVCVHGVLFFFPGMTFFPVARCAAVVEEMLMGMGASFLNRHVFNPTYRHRNWRKERWEVGEEGIYCSGGVGGTGEWRVWGCRTPS